MADLSCFNRGQIVGARMVGARVTKRFDVSRCNVSKVMIAFEKKRKRPQQSTSLAESQSYLRETIGLYINVFERLVQLRRLKLLLSLMNTFRTQCPKFVPRELHKGTFQ